MTYYTYMYLLYRDYLATPTCLGIRILNPSLPPVNTVLAITYIHTCNHPHSSRVRPGRWLLAGSLGFQKYEVCIH